jgi:putative transposase
LDLASVLKCQASGLTNKTLLSSCVGSATGRTFNLSQYSDISLRHNRTTEMIWELQYSQMPYSEILHGRKSEIGGTYSITFCTEQRRPIFLNPANAKCVLDKIKQSEEVGHCCLHAAVVMPDHVHMLITLRKIEIGMGRVISAIKNISARMISSSSKDGMRIWQAGFYEHRLRSNEDLRKQARYIIANPLRAGLVRSINEYKFWYAKWAPPPFGINFNDVDVSQVLEDSESEFNP